LKQQLSSIRRIVFCDFQSKNSHLPSLWSSNWPFRFQCFSLTLLLTLKFARSGCNFEHATSWVNMVNLLLAMHIWQ
jgi:hypothetical protein